MEVRIEIKLDKSRMDAIMAASPRIEQIVVERAAEQTKRLAKAIVPVDTGALRGSIDWVHLSSNVAVVWALTDYALYVELGTRKMAARPYLVPAVNAVPWVALLREAFREAGL